MRKQILILLAVLYLANTSVQAQQDPMFTKYMFNSLVFNPGYAGSHEYMSVRLLYRNQWWGIEGAPKTQSMTIHSPLGDRVGVGLSLVNDAIGATASTSANASYAYRIPFGKGKVSIGLQAGAMNWRADWTVLRFKDPKGLDGAFEDTNPSLWLPNFGAGVFYYSQLFYIGFSSPNLINADLRKDVDSSITKWAKRYRHFYLTGGAALPINGPALIFKPSFLIKSVGLLGDFSNDAGANRVGAPTEFDVDLSLMFFETLWVGLSFRSAIEVTKSSIDSGDVWASFYLKNGLRIGASYDYTLTKLQEYAEGSFEVMLGYDFNYAPRQVATPRYF